MSESETRTVAIAVLAAVVVAGSLGLASAQQVPLPASSIPKFVEPLPVFTPDFRVDGKKPLLVTMKEIQQQVLPAALYPAGYSAGTYVWAYEIDELNPDGTISRDLPAVYPGITVVAQRGTPTRMKFVNELAWENSQLAFLYPTGPNAPPIWAVDQTLNWAFTPNPMPSGYKPPLTPYSGPIPACVHLHGGEVPSAYDGGPDAWFTAEGLRGPGFVTDEYRYPNAQEPGTLWFHDHGLGVTRLNPFAGLAAFYLLRDPAHEDANLPSGLQEIEIALQDRLFDVNGQLIFPSQGINPTIHPYWVPEYFGDAIVVNGKTWPYLDVEPRRYRFRLLNGSNARFYNLSLLDRMSNIRLPFHVIGTETGYLDAPAPVTYLLIAPGERYDIVVDFTNSAGVTFTVDNDAKSPFPDGTPVDPRSTGQIMQMRVVLPLSGPDGSCDPAIAGSCVLRPEAIVRLNPAPAQVVTRRLTLNEEMGAGGPLEMTINNTKLGQLGVTSPGGILSNKDERPRVGATEIWEVINLTADTHPLHTHLVAFQVLGRQRLDLKKYDKAYASAFPGGFNPGDGLTYLPGVFMPGFGPPMGYGTCESGAVCGGNPDPTPYLKGVPIPPAASEGGWKDTVQMNPGEVTRIAIRWAPTDTSLDDVEPGDNRFPFDPTAPLGVTDRYGYPGGPGYVWHCHIIDHEDNEMMKRYDVTK